MRQGGRKGGRVDDGESVLEAHTHSLSHTALQRQEGRVRDAEKKKRSERERRRECLLRGWLSFLVHKPALAETPWAVSAPAPSVRPSLF